MNHESMRDISVPFKIPSEAISLPTRGATVTKCTLFHEGDMDPEPFSKLYGLTFTADVYRIEGVIHSVDLHAPDIHFEAGMPVNWNGKVIQQGGAGINGYVPPCTMNLHGQDRENSALKQGYVVFGSDSGHTYINGNMMDCSWALNQECFENFAYVSLKKTKDTVMYLAELFYGEKPKRVYFYGGSNGGRECMKAVQNYPGDYDGAVCFYPVLYWVLKVLMDARNAEILEQIGQAGWIGEETDRQILKATMDLCDGLDGALDGVISDSKAAAKKQGEVLKAVKKIVSGEQYQMLETLALPMTLPFPLAYGEVSLPGYQVFEGASSLFHFEFLNMAHDAGAVSISDSLIANVFAQDPDFDTRRFEPQEWRERIQEISRWMDAYSTDLDAFAKKGGKMILVQGTVDPQVTSYGTIWFYEKLLKKYGKERLDSFLKFYLAPGYGHGADGTFLITSDFLGALDRWVEKEQVPKTMIVKDIHPDTKGRTRPLYEYPGYPYYAGAGDIDRAESYFRKE